MELLDLFLTFVQIGFTSFGGLSMVPLISSEMLRHGWMTPAEILDIIAIAEMTPGPLGINCATFVGTRVAGVAGALAANLGALTPAFTLCLAAAIFFERWKRNRLMQEAMYGIRPVCIGLIAATLITLLDGNYIVGGALYWPSLVIGGVLSVAIWRWKLSVPKTICIAALLGMLLVR